MMVRTRHQGIAALVLAAVIGVVHGSFSVYWSFGGRWLLDTVGQDVIGAFDGRAWLLALTGAIKIAAAVIPVLVTLQSWRHAAAWRFAAWAGACVLILWGGANTVTANLVVRNLIPAPVSADRAGLWGHALLWDPMFLLWGVALVAGLFLTRVRNRAG